MDETGRFFINCDMMRISWDIPNQHDLIFGLYNCNVSKSWFFILLLASNGYFLSSSSAWVENFADVTNFTGWKRFYSRVPCLECLCARYPILQTMTWQSLPLTLSNQISWCPGWMVHDSWWGGYSNKVWEWLKNCSKSGRWDNATLTSPVWVHQATPMTWHTHTFFFLRYFLSQ